MSDATVIHISQFLDRRAKKTPICPTATEWKSDTELQQREKNDIIRDFVISVLEKFCVNPLSAGEGNFDQIEYLRLSVAEFNSIGLTHVAFMARVMELIQHRIKLMPNVNITNPHSAQDTYSVRIAFPSFIVGLDNRHTTPYC